MGKGFPYLPLILTYAVAEKASTGNFKGMRSFFIYVFSGCPAGYGLTFEYFFHCGIKWLVARSEGLKVFSGLSCSQGCDIFSKIYQDSEERGCVF